MDQEPDGDFMDKKESEGLQRPILNSPSAFFPHADLAKFPTSSVSIESWCAQLSFSQRWLLTLVWPTVWVTTDFRSAGWKIFRKLYKEAHTCIPST